MDIGSLLYNEFIRLIVQVSHYWNDPDTKYDFMPGSIGSQTIGYFFRKFIVPALVTTPLATDTVNAVSL